MPTLHAFSYVITPLRGIFREVVWNKTILLKGIPRRGLQVLSLSPPPCHPSACGLSSPLPRGTRAHSGLTSACFRSLRVLRHQCPPLGGAWGLGLKVVRCGCEVVGCSWVGSVLWCGVEGGERSMVWGFRGINACPLNLLTRQSQNQPEREILENGDNAEIRKIRKNKSK